MRKYYKEYIVAMLISISMIGCGGGGGGGGDTNSSSTDSTKPVITISGDNPLRLKKGTDFSDPGATAKDNTDGDITDKITTTNNIDKNVVGEYSVEYTVKDKAGNGGTKTRTVSVYAFHFTSNNTDTVDECQANIMTVTTADATGAVIYSISKDDSNATEINATTGILSFKAKKLPDYETQTEYIVTVKAIDTDNKPIEQNITIAVDSVIINFNSKDYGCVPSPYTGKIWLDRNIGATRLCEDINDTQCFGDYYQWGRSADGHEKFNSETNDTKALNIPMKDSETSYTKFITVSDYNIGWVESGKDNNGSLRMAEWQKSDGSTVCPDGYYVADGFSIANELIKNDDNITNARIDLNSTDKSGNSDNRLVNAYNTFLKLPTNGLRDKNGSIAGSTKSTFLWSSTAADDNLSITFNLDKDVINFENAPRVFGFAIRCIKQ